MNNLKSNSNVIQTTYQSTYQPTYQPTYLFSYLCPTCLTNHLPIYIHSNNLHPLLTSTPSLIFLDRDLLTRWNVESFLGLSTIIQNHIKIWYYTKSNWFNRTVKSKKITEHFYKKKQIKVANILNVMIKICMLPLNYTDYLVGSLLFWLLWVLHEPAPGEPGCPMVGLRPRGGL